MAEVVVQTPFVQHTANGATTVFAYAFEVPTAADMVVYANGIVVASANYTLAGVGVQAGGSVTFLVAPLNGTIILLSREIPLQRLIGYQTLGDFRAVVVNPDFNRIWMALQGLVAGRGSGFIGYDSSLTYPAGTVGYLLQQSVDLTLYARKAGGNVFTGLQTVTPVALTDAATIATDGSLSNHFRVTLGGNRTLGNPTNMLDGAIYNWKIKQDGTGSRTLAYGSKFKWAAGTAPTLTTTAAATDYISAQYWSDVDILIASIIKGLA